MIRVTLGRMVLVGWMGLAFYLCGCQGIEGDDGTYLRFENSEKTDRMDSLLVLGINGLRGDTVWIGNWHTGEAFPAEMRCPADLEDSFTLLVKGFKGDALVYQIRLSVAGGRTQSQVRDFRLAAPALTDAPIALTVRARSGILLEPAWEEYPGIYREADTGEAAKFTTDAVYAWVHNGQIIGRDSVLKLGAVAFADSGAYLFIADNLAGRDSQTFVVTVRHMLPVIAAIKAQAVLAGKSLTIIPSITSTDSLVYRWMKDDVAVGKDSVLTFMALAEKDTGSYQLVVANASDTTQTAVSNHFTVVFAPDPNATWKPEKAITVGAQTNSTYGTALDLDTQKAMFSGEASTKQPLIDLLFVYSGGSTKLMSAVAGKQASDLSYADGFDAGKLADTKFVKVSSKPATPEAARKSFEAGSKVNSLAVAAGQSFLVKTTDGNLSWLKIESIQGGTGSSASANLTVALALPPSQ